MKPVKWVSFAVGIAVIVFMILGVKQRERPAVSDQIVVTGIGIRATETGYQLSVQAVEALKTAGSLSEQTENATAVYKANGDSIATALRSFLNEAGRSTYILHNRILALQLPLPTDRSLYDTLDYFTRNLEGRSLVDVVICREDPAALLSITSGNDAIPAEYVSQLLQEGNDQGMAVQTRLLDIQRASSGMYDAVLPILKLTDNTPQLDGTALFRKGEYVGELTVSETTGLLFAADRINHCLYTVDGTTFLIRNVSTALQITQTADAFSYTFSVTGEAIVTESRNTALAATAMNGLTAQLKKRLQNDIQAALGKTVLYRTDPLGLARQTAKTYPVTQETASTRLAQSTYTATVDLRLIESSY